MNKRRWIATAVGLFVALGLPSILGLLLGQRPGDLAIPRRALILVAEEWLVTLVLLGIVLLWEKQPLTSIGLKRPSWGDALWGVVGFIVGAISFMFTTPLVEALGLSTTTAGIAELAQTPIALRVLIVITAGITEEILARGYPIERLAHLTGRPIWGAVIGYVAFVLPHIPLWGLGGTIQIGVWSIIVTALYVKRRNLPACILMHILNDAYAFILLPMLFASRT